MEIKSQAYNRNVAIYGFAVLVVAVLLTLPWLGLGHFYTRGEPREALVAVAMMEQGNYILPVFQGEIAFKPPMLHWLVSLFSLPQGYVSEYTARMPSAIASIVIVFAFFVFYSRRVGYGKSLVASLLLITCFEVHRAAMTCRVDMVLMAFTVGSMMALSRWLENGCRRLPVLASLLASGAVLTKGPVGVILPCFALVIYMVVRRERWNAIVIAALKFVALSVIVPLFWYVAAYMQGGDRFLQLVIEENFGRFLGKMSYESHENGVFYNVEMLLAGLLPYTLLLVFGLFVVKWRKPDFGKNWLSRIWNRFCAIDNVRMFAIIVAVCVFVFYCIPKSKRSVYLIPVYPFIAYFLAEYMLYAWRFRPMLLKAFGHMMAVLVWGLLALFAIVRLGGISDAVFAGHHATENIAFLYAMKTVPIGIVGLLLLTGIIVTTSTYFLLCRRGKFLHWGLYGIFAVIFSLYMALDGMFVPIILNVKSDKPVAQYIAEVVPEGKLYSCYTNQVTGNPMRQFSINFYLGDRVVPFEGERPTEGYLVAGEEDAAIFKEKHNGYRLELVYDSGHRRCDDHKIVCLYYFRKMER